MTEVQIKLTAMVDQFNQAFLDAGRKVSGLGKEVDNAARKLQSASTNMISTGKTMAMTVSAPIVALGAIAAKGWADAEQAELRLRAALESSGDASESTLQSLQAYADGLERTLAIDADLIQETMQLGLSMGISSNQIKDATREAVGLSKAYNVDLNMAMKAVAKARQGDYAGAQKMIPAMKALGTESEKYAAFQKAVANGMNIAEKGAGGFTGSMQKLQFTINKVGDAAGKFIEMYVVPLANKVRDWVDEFNNADESTQRTVFGIVALAAAIAPIVMIVGKMIAAYSTWIVISGAVRAALAGEALAAGASTGAVVAYRVASKAATIATWLWNAALAANPITLLIMAIAAAVSAVIILSNAQDDSTESAKDWTAELQNTQAALNGTLEVSQEVAQKMSKVWDQVTANLTDAEKLEAANREIEALQIKLSEMREDTSKPYTISFSADSLDSYAQLTEKLADLVKKRDALERQANSNRKQQDEDAAKKWLADRKAALEKYNELIATAGKDEIELEERKQQQEHAALNEGLARGFYSLEYYNTASEAMEVDHEERLTKIKRKAEEKRAETQVKLFENSLSTEGNYHEKALAIQKAYEDKSISGTQAMALQVASIITSAWGAINNLMNALYEAEAQAVEDKYARLTAAENAYSAYQAQQEQVAFNKLSNRSKKEETLKKNADEAATEREKKKAKELRKIQREQAIAQRAMTLFQIPVNTASAIMQIWSNPSTVSPYEVARIGLTAVVGALAAAQMAATLAAPLPALAAGGIAKGRTIVEIGEKNDEVVFPLHSTEGKSAMRLLADNLVQTLNGSIPISQATQIVQIQPADVYIGTEKVGKIIFNGTKNGEILVHQRGVVS